MIRELLRVGVALAAVPALLGSACGGGPAFPTAPELYAEALARFDGNGDGVVDAAEYARFDTTPGAFQDIDSGKDGRIDAAEFGKWLETTEPRAMTAP